MKFLCSATAALLACVIAVPAQAQFRKPEDAVKYRQSAMFVMGTNLYGRLGAMVNGRAPFDAKVAADVADAVVVLSRLPWMGFVPGSENVGKTDAKPAVWTEQAKFRDLGEKMQAEAVKLQAATKTGDLDAIKAAYRATTSSCKACHDSYTSQ